MSLSNKTIKLLIAFSLMGGLSLATWVYVTSWSITGQVTASSTAEDWIICTSDIPESLPLSVEEAGSVTFTTDCTNENDNPHNYVYNYAVTVTDVVDDCTPDEPSGDYTVTSSKADGETFSLAVDETTSETITIAYLAKSCPATIDITQSVEVQDYTVFITDFTIDYTEHTWTGVAGTQIGTAVSVYGSGLANGQYIKVTFDNGVDTPTVRCRATKNADGSQARIDPEYAPLSLGVHDVTLEAYTTSDCSGTPISEAVLFEDVITTTE